VLIFPINPGPIIRESGAIRQRGLRHMYYDPQRESLLLQSFPHWRVSRVNLAEQLHARNGRNNAIRLSGNEWLWSAKRA
jgi:hypothetical protein